MEKLYKVCDLCGYEYAPTDNVQNIVKRYAIEIGSSFDGHRNEADYSNIDLCDCCKPKFDNFIERIADKAHDVTRVYNKETVAAVLATFLNKFGPINYIK